MTTKDKHVEIIDFGSAISDRYLSYALSTIMSRSLPDVRDGLKPVHRRLLYAMMKLKLHTSHSGYKKCARVVGDVIGKYHPHGDIAVYDTLVRLAQGFSLRYPLIDGQGNFGSIDGDNAAAMRYTESRMTEICTLLIEDIDKNTVNFYSTYDNSDSEPELLPAKFPNLLANGTEGIAVGMATSIPPHNLHELCDALIFLVDNQQSANTADIMKFIKGPDLPTGGVIVDSIDSIHHTYTTGKGSFKVRAKWKTESLPHGAYQIVITEIPYHIQKSQLIASISELCQNKKIPFISNIRDESTENIRIIIEPKATEFIPQIVMEALFKQTSLESRIYLNMNVLSSQGYPKTMNILEVLAEFITYRKEIITRRTEFCLNKITDRLETLQVLKIVHLNLDEVVRIIRGGHQEKEELMNKFNINIRQAEIVLNIKLGSLQKIQEKTINIEYSRLTEEYTELQKNLNDPKQLIQVLKDELTEVKYRFGKGTKNGKRKTKFQSIKDCTSGIDISAFMTRRDPITVLCSQMGWIRCIPGHNLNLSGIQYKEGDAQRYIVESYTTDSIIICSTAGKCFTILSNNIIQSTKDGASIRFMIDIEHYDINNMFLYQRGQKILIASNDGRGFIVNSENLISSTRSGKQVLNVVVQDNNKCLVCSPVKGDMVAVIGTNGKLIVFPVAELPEIKRGQGVRLQKYQDGEELKDIQIFDSYKGLKWNVKNKTYLIKDTTLWRAKHGSIGAAVPIRCLKQTRCRT